MRHARVAIFPTTLLLARLAVKQFAPLQFGRGSAISWAPGGIRRSFLVPSCIAYAATVAAAHPHANHYANLTVLVRCWPHVVCQRWRTSPIRVSRRGRRELP